MNADIESSPVEGRWYLARIKRGSADIIRAQLANLGVETYFPTVLVAGRGRLRGERPLFPNYLFFQIPTGFDKWRSIRYAGGIRQLVMSDQNPTPLPEGFVENLRQYVYANTHL